MDTLTEQLHDMIQPLCEEQGLILVGVALHGVANARTLRITADTEAGITLKQCKVLSNEISDLLFRKELIAGNYRIEVSSPGLNKPLEHPFEYRRNLNRDLKVSFVQDGESREVVGKLIELSDAAITLELKKERIVVALDQIEKAVVKLKW